jgi:flagellar basal-body rod protein FlgG
MAIAALNSAATGLRSLSTQIDVIANNLSNAETTGFKGSRVNFEDLMYQTLQQPGATNAAGDVAPSGIFVGLGTQIANTELDLTQGSPDQTNRDKDVAINGMGFFRVKVLSSLGDGTAYTRNGNFQVNNNGELVVGSGDGYRLDPSITLPKSTTQINISADGVITALVAGKTQPTQVGTLQLTNFINPQGLNQLGGGLYQETDSSGPPVTGTPGTNGTGMIQQGYLEESNVDPVKELVTLIKTQRSFELNSQSIQTADQALQTIANLKRS